MTDVTPSPDPLEVLFEFFRKARTPGVMNDVEVAVAALTTLREQMEAKDAALRTIRNERQPQVCENYELCTHEGCRASYEAFVIADIALSPTGEPTKRDSKGREHATGCTFDEDVRFPVCTCGTWPKPHLNATGEPTKDERCPFENCVDGRWTLATSPTKRIDNGPCPWPGHTKDKT